MSAWCSGSLYFLGPFNLLRHGIGDVIDDRGRPTASGLPMAVAIAVTNVPLLLALAVIGGAPATLALLLVVGVAVAGGVPVIRSHRAWPALWPFVEATLIAGAALCGLFVGGRDVGSVPWSILVALWLWAVAAAALSMLAGLRSVSPAAVTTPPVPETPVQPEAAEVAPPNAPFEAPEAFQATLPFDTGAPATPTEPARPVEPATPADEPALPIAWPTGLPRLGPRAIAGLALAADVVAVGLLARHGPLGLLAAAGVALYAGPARDGPYRRRRPGRPRHRHPTRAARPGWAGHPRR